MFKLNFQLMSEPITKTYSGRRFESAISFRHIMTRIVNLLDEIKICVTMNPLNVLINKLKDEFAIFHKRLSICYAHAQQWQY